MMSNKIESYNPNVDQKKSDTKEYNSIYMNFKIRKNSHGYKGQKAVTFWEEGMGVTGEM